MTVAEVNKHFALDRSIKVALREQLQNKLERFISNADPGTVLPSERQLQEELGVSRVTVRNAIMPLFRRGLLERNSGQGTRVALAGKLNNPESGKIHQMALGTPVLKRQKMLTLALYENIPTQKEFWEYAVNSFNLLYPQQQIAIEWVPFEVNSNDYLSYIEQSKPDIFQYEQLPHNDICAALPTALLDQWCRDTDLFNKVEPCSLTYGYSAPQIYWNADLAQQAGLTEVRALLTQGKYYELIAQALEKLPENVAVSGHVWDYFALIVAGSNYMDLDEKQLQKSLVKLAQFANRTRAFAVRQVDPYDAVRNFVAGRQLLVTTHPAAIQAHRDKINFKYNYSPVFLAPGQKLLAVPMQIAIYSGTSHLVEAGLFLQHLLSECMQSQLILRREVYPVRDSVWRSMAALKYQLSEFESTQFRCQLMTSDNRLLYNFLIFGIRDDLADLLLRHVDCNIVFKQIMLKWQQLKTVNKVS